MAARMTDFGNSVDGAALKQGLMAQKSALLATKTQELSKNVLTGKMSFQDAEKALETYRHKLGVIDDGSQAASKGIATTTRSMGDMINTVKGVTVGVAAMGATFKQAFNLSKEGAGLNQLRDSFELMNQEVFKTPGLLDAMSEAARGTLKETDLMKGLLTLTAGTTDEVAQAMAAAAPRLLEIAKASNKLNPALGDTAFLFDSVARGVKRQSPLILDNLGLNIKLEAAYQTMADSLGVSVDSLDANQRTMAVLNATLAAGDQLIAQVGGSVDSQADAWARLEVKVGETTDGFKQFLAEGLYPVIEAASGGYSTSVGGIIEKNIAAGKSMADLVAQGQRLTKTIDDVGAGGLKVTGTYDQFQQSLRDTAMAIIKNSDGAVEARKNLEAAFGPDLFRNVDEMGLSFIDLGLGVSIFTAEIDRASDHSSRFNQQLNDLRYITDEYAPAVNGAVGAASDFGAELARLTQLGAEAQQVQNALNQEMNAMTAGALGDVESTIGDPIRSLLAAQQQLADSQGEWVQVTISNAGKIGAINSELASDLTNEQANAYREIVRTAEEGGAEWLAAYNALQGDLSESQREALIAQRAELGAVGDTVGSAYTGSIEDAEAAQMAIDEANQAIIDSYRELAYEGALALAELSPDPNAIQNTLDYGVAIGYMTQQEADMRKQAADTRLALKDLNVQVVQAGLDTNIAALAFELLASGQYSTAEAAIAAAEKHQILLDLFAMTPEKVETAYTLFMGDSIARLQEVKGLLDGLDGRSVSANVNVNTATAGDLGSGSGGDPDKKAHGGNVSAGMMYQAGEFNQPELLEQEQGNALYIIPGDQGRVFSNSQAGGMGGININGPLIGQVVQRAGESGPAFANRLSTMVAEKLGNLK